MPPCVMQLHAWAVLSITWNFSPSQKSFSSSGPLNFTFVSTTRSPRNDALFHSRRTGASGAPPPSLDPNAPHSSPGGDVGDVREEEEDGDEGAGAALEPPEGPAVGLLLLPLSLLLGAGAEGPEPCHSCFFFCRGIKGEPNERFSGPQPHPSHVAVLCGG